MLFGRSTIVMIFMIAVCLSPVMAVYGGVGLLGVYLIVPLLPKER